MQQNAVDVRVVIETVDQVGQVLLGGVRRQIIGLGKKAYLFAVFTLVRDINLGSRVIAHQDDRQAGGAQAALAALTEAARSGQGNLLDLAIQAVRPLLSMIWAYLPLASSSINCTLVPALTLPRIRYCLPGPPCRKV